MLKLEFINAKAEDRGYGLQVNDRSLEDIISLALGTKVEDRGGYRSNLPVFKSNCCDITIIIDPKPTISLIESGEEVWKSVEELEEDMCERIKAKDAEADTES